MSVLGDKLKVVLADSFTFYLKAHYFHWNIEGPDFPQYHKFLQKLYEEVFEAVDTIAEHIRTLDEYAPGSYKRFMELSNIETVETIPDARSMMSALLADNGKIIAVLSDTLEVDFTPEQRGIENFLQDRLDIHQKHSWMLRSILKK
jgi:starvation-inducible DNA-binding protein